MASKDEPALTPLFSRNFVTRRLSHRQPGLSSQRKVAIGTLRFELRFFHSPKVVP